MATRDEGQPTVQRIHRRIFVSSSNVDLYAHRQAVWRVLQDMDQQVMGMEHFDAQDGDATTVSLDELAGAEVSLFIVAWRYGTIPEGETRSATHLEYEAAKQSELPRLVFLADPSTQVDDTLFPADRRNPAHHDQLLAFRAELTHDRVAAFFTTPDNLAAHIGPAVARYLLGEQYAEQLRSFGLQPPRDLPPRAPGFVGREPELAELCQQLREGRSTGLSAAVAGMAGVGKSALAAEAVHQLATEPGLFPGGITFVRCDGRTGLAGLAWVYARLLAAWSADLTPEELAPATTPEAEVDLRERALRFRLRPHNLATVSAGTRESEYKEQQGLVLLDTVESELPLTRLLETLTSLGLTALVTARYLPSTPYLHVRSLDVLDQGAAVQLFAERFQARGGEWEAGRDKGPTTEVVDALGQTPLAIELAAARAALSHLHVTELASQLRTADRLGKLRDPLDPARGVHYVLEQSLHQLTSWQQFEFAALNLLGGSAWPRNLVEDYLARLISATTDGQEGPVVSGKVSAPGHSGFTPPDDAREQARVDLEVLIARSLVSLLMEDARMEPDEATGDAVIVKAQPEIPSREVRIRMHPLVREFAATTWMRQPEAIRQLGPDALLAAVGKLLRVDFSMLAQEMALAIGGLEGVETTKTTTTVKPPVVTARIFVSHNHEDNVYCREFVAALRKGAGSEESVWYDEHNLGWGKLRREIERELAERQHFIAILSPTAVKSEWVNDEIDAAIELRRRGSMQTIQFVLALPCEMPLLLSNYKRVVGPDGQPYTPQDSASRALAVIRSLSLSGD